MTERRKQVHLQISSTEKLNTAVRQAAKKRRQSVGQFVREVIASALGRPELAEKVRVGRPKVDE